VPWADVTVFELQALLVAIAMTGLVLGVAVDERERAAEDLKGTLRLAAAGEMAAALAHEMSQPLTALQTYASAVDLVMSAPGLDDRERLARLGGVAGRMADETRRAGDVVTRLRDFFRSGDTRLERVAPATLFMQAIEGCERSAQSRGVSLRGHADPRLPAVLVDPIQIAVVLRNLIRNALEATAPTHGQVEIGVASWRDALRFDVRDDGPGVEDERRERLFEPGPSRKPGGMGVGLSICRAIVEAHGGRLWIEDAAHGHFVFTVPLDGPPSHDG
jgi:signal transduction histidine kinase